jgi:hypothetical protein
MITFETHHTFWMNFLNQAESIKIFAHFSTYIYHDFLDPIAPFTKVLGKIHSAVGFTPMSSGYCG